MARPNFLILVSDQHSRHHLGCYGDRLVRTPHLDRLAAAGCRLDAAYCAAPLCVPSRMALMTSRRPTANRVWNNQQVLSSAIPTWAHAMGAAGYETALVGRMHFVGADQRHGFELRPVGEYSAVYPGAPRQGASQFQTIPSTTSGQTRVAVEIAGRGRTTYQAFDEIVAGRAVAYLQQRAAGADGRPFAAVVGFVLPHCPFVAPPDLFDYYLPRVDVPEQPAPETQPAAIVRFRRQRGILEPFSDQQVRVARAAYFGMCEHLDRQVGRVLEALDATGLARDTLVMYTSDHGEMAGEHGCWWKSNYYEGSVGVPLLARLPGAIPAGSTSSRVCSLMDLGPTMLEAAGAPPLPAADGHSLWPTLLGDADSRRPDVVFAEHGPTRADAPSRMVRQGRWKLYQQADGTPPVLFDLETDPGEWHDRGADPALLPVRDRLLALLRDGWDPGYVQRESAALARDMEVLQAWGRVTRPVHPDALPVPAGVEQVERL